MSPTRWSSRAPACSPVCCPRVSDSDHITSRTRLFATLKNTPSTVLVTPTSTHSEATRSPSIVTPDHAHGPTPPRPIRSPRPSSVPTAASANPPTAPSCPPSVQSDPALPRSLLSAQKDARFRRSPVNGCLTNPHILSTLPPFPLPSGPTRKSIIIPTILPSLPTQTRPLQSSSMETRI